jgi:hypothetical protein
VSCACFSSSVERRKLHGLERRVAVRIARNVFTPMIGSAPVVLQVLVVQRLFLDLAALVLSSIAPSTPPRSERLELLRAPPPRRGRSARR